MDVVNLLVEISAARKNERPGSFCDTILVTGRQLDRETA
jgi:hypothetical protein